MKTIPTRRAIIIPRVHDVLDAQRRLPAPRDLVYASEVTRCRRRVTFAMLGVAPDTREPNGGAALMGTAIHEYLEKILEQAFEGHCQTEVRLSNDCVSGRADAIIETSEGRVVVDIKTVGAREWTASSKTEEYLDQLNIYAAIAHAQHLVVVRVNRDTGFIDELWFAPDRARAERLFARAREMQALARDGLIAEAERWGTAECTYCVFRKQCETLEADVRV